MIIVTLTAQPALPPLHPHSSVDFSEDIPSLKPASSGKQLQESGTLEIFMAGQPTPPNVRTPPEIRPY